MLMLQAHLFLFLLFQRNIFFLIRWCSTQIFHKTSYICGNQKQHI